MSTASCIVQTPAFRRASQRQSTATDCCSRKVCPSHRPYQRRQATAHARKLGGSTDAAQTASEVTTGQHAKDWSALAEVTMVASEDDQEFIASINELCNQAVRLMLRDEFRGIRQFTPDLYQMGEFCAQQNNLKAALLVYVVLKMTEHVIPKQTENLEGVYRMAYEKMFGLLEDSGWQLTKEGEEPTQEHVDDEQMPLGVPNYNA